MLSREILRSIPQSIRIIRRLSSGQLTGGFTLPHLRVLILVKEGKGVSQIAEVLHISPAAVSKMVNGLVAKKLVKRTPGKDGRCVGLVLTSKGQRTLSSVSGNVEKKLEEGLVRLSLKERRDLMKGIKTLDRLMSMFNEV